MGDGGKERKILEDSRGDGCNETGKQGGKLTSSKVGPENSSRSISTIQL